MGVGMREKRGGGFVWVWVCMCAYVHVVECTQPISSPGMNNPATFLSFFFPSLLIFTLIFFFPSFLSHLCFPHILSPPLPPTPVFSLLFFYSSSSPPFSLLPSPD